MEQTLKVKEAIIPLSQVHEKTAQCPTCGSGTVFTEGYYQRYYTESWEKGTSLEQVLGDYVSVVTHIICTKCEIRFAILSDADYHDKKELMELRINKARAEYKVQEPITKQRVM